MKYRCSVYKPERQFLMYTLYTEVKVMSEYIYKEYLKEVISCVPHCSLMSTLSNLNTGK